MTPTSMLQITPGVHSKELIRNPRSKSPLRPGHPVRASFRRKRSARVHPFCFWPVSLCALSLITIQGCQKIKPDSAVSSPWSRADRQRIELEHDFGLVRSGETVQHRFTIKNDSEMRWTSANVRSYCRCTASTAGASTVSPGQSIDVTVGYTPSGANGPDSR